MGRKIQLNRILAFGILLIAIPILILPSSFSGIWPYDVSWELVTFHIIANLAALLACVISLVLIWKHQPKAYVMDLVLFLSFTAFTYGI